MANSYKFVDINGNQIEESLRSSTTKDGLMSKDDKTKLDGIAEGANKYTHPTSHAATIITEDATHRFVTDTEKASWNAKASTAVVTTTANGLMTKEDKIKLNGIAEGANKITVDSALNSTSTNPVQNKVIKTELDKKPELQYFTADNSIGKVWKQSNIATNTNIDSVYYGNGVWVAGTSSGVMNGIYYSLDGKNWTLSNMPSYTYRIIYYDNGIWVAGSYSSKGLYYSLDGKTWTQSNITSGDFICVYYGNNIWVAANNDISGGDGIGLYYSLDGKTWTQSNITSGNFYTVYYDNNIWVAGRDDFSGLYYSTDGKIWNQSNITAGYFYSVYYANGIWVAAGNSNYGLLYSLDGKTWSRSNITNISISYVHYANGIWVASNYYSLDGKTWTISNITSGFQYLYYANNVWVAGSISKGLYYSLDGKSWTQSNITSNGFSSIYYANGIWVTGDTRNSSGLYYSEESITADKTVTELTTAYNSGKMLFCKYYNAILPLTSMNTNSDPRFVFSGTIDCKAFCININSDNTIYCSCNELTNNKLSNVDTNVLKEKVEAIGFSSDSGNNNPIEFITWEAND